MKKTLKTLAVVMLSVAATTSFAQGTPRDEEQCANGNSVLENYSLYYEYAKQKNYKEAYEFWKPLYNKVPDYNKNIYIHGEAILKTMINESIKAKDVEGRKARVQELMELYDNRIKYFGDDEKKPAATILGDKAINYLALNGKEADENLAFTWLSQVAEEQKGDADAKVLTQFVNLSYNKFKKDPSFKNDYIDNYMKGSEYIDEALDRYQMRLDDNIAIIHGEKAGDAAKAAKDSVTAKSFIEYTRKSKIAMINQFAGSGAADVNTLVSVFEPQVEAKKSDNTFLKNVSKLLGRTSEGRETELYTRVADYSYQIEPSMEAAKGLAQSAVRAKDWDRALNYYDEALKMAIQPDDKTEILKYQAAIYMNNRNFSKTREVCRRSLSIDPDQADPHIMIANCYASSASQVGLDGAISGLVFVAAVNELNAAHAVDPSNAQINSTIARYKAAYPEKSQLFMRGIQSGTSYTIGGWMGVTITVP